MKIWMTLLLLGGALCLQSAPAPAQAYDGFTFSMQDRGGGGGRREARQEARDTRAAPPPAPPVQRERTRGQLSDEDRRQLHRDLEKANRELYRGKR